MYDVVVIGGGSAGLTVSIGAAQFGLKVLLVEGNALGGECLNAGCVPSKALIKAASVAQQIRNAKKYGVHVASAKVDFKKVMNHVHSVQDTIRLHEDEKALKKHGVEVAFGYATFKDRYSIIIEKDGKKRTVKARKFAICTGSKPLIPPIPGADKVNLLTNENIFLLEKLPRKFAVIGGGPIGCEMAQAFSRLGSNVTMFLREHALMEREDGEVSDFITRTFEDEGITLVKQCMIDGLKQEGKKIVICDKKDIPFDEILMATGRSPNCARLGLDNIGVAYTKRGITVNKHLQTTVSNIYAVGDVNGSFMFSHYALHEGIQAVSHMVAKVGKRDEKFVPWTTFTDPEVARAGYTEEEAKKAGISYEVAKLPLSHVDRSVTEGSTKGFCKLLIRRNKIIGIHLVGPRAGEVFHELYLAMKQGISTWKLNSLIHVYPTHSDAITKALGEYYLPKVFTPFVKKIAQFLIRL